MAEQRSRRLLRVARGGLAGLAIEVAIVCVLAAISVVVAVASSVAF